MDLIADIGASNSRLALLDSDGQIARTASYINTEFDSLESILARFLAESGNQAPRRAAMAIAAPLAGDEVVMTNIGWRFSRQDLGRALACDELQLLNDFEALALALPQLAAGDCHAIGRGHALPGAAMAVIGPGSGLGVAATVPAGDGWAPLAGEGGHVSLPAFTPTEAALVAEHGDANGHCSAERLLSGPGLVKIHASLARLSGAVPGAASAADITDRAARGDALALEVLEVFFALLGTVAGNLALTVGARGGVFIAGGIAPRLLDTMERSSFRERFVARGRYRTYLDAIPTAVIVAPNPAFIGLRAALAQRGRNAGGSR